MKTLLLIVTVSVVTLFFLAMPATGQTNIALGKRVNQSSDGYPDLGKASAAVDGNTDGNYLAGSVTHTKESGEMYPRLEIHLEAVYQINEIRIWNRTDCCPERLNDLLIIVSDVDANQVHNFGPYPSAGMTNPFIIPINVKGSHLTVMIDRENAILSLAEVEVFGVPESQPIPRPTPQPPPILSAPARLSPKEDYEFRTSNPNRGTAVLAWGKVSGATIYQVEVQKYRSADGTYVPTINTTSYIQRISLSTLSPGSYRWTVKAINTNGVPGYQGGWSRFSIKYYFFGLSYREKNFWESDGTKFLPFELLSFKNS